MLQDNQRLGDYQLIRRVASGGMADVYVAQSYATRELLAIKVIHSHLSRDRELIQMLINEGELTQLLKHPHIVDVRQLSQVGDEHFIVMELIQGRDIYQALITLDQQGRKMPLEVALLIIIEACAGLHYAHTARDPQGRPLNVIHRDISPQNILISYEGVTKLIDFGIAKASQRDSYTQQGVLKGKYYYMSPEQAWGDQVDLRSDLFSLGICLYEMVAGEMLYSEEDGLALLEQVRRAEIPPLSAVRPDAPPELEQLIRKALAPEPHQRFQSAEEMRLALDHFLKSYAPGVTSPSHLRRFMWDLFGPPPDPTVAPEEELGGFGEPQEATRAVSASAFAQLATPQPSFQEQERTRAVSASAFAQLATPSPQWAAPTPGIEGQERTRAVSAEMMAQLASSPQPAPQPEFQTQERTRAVSAEMMAQLASNRAPAQAPSPSFQQEERTRAVNASQMIRELSSTRGLPQRALQQSPAPSPPPAPALHPPSASPTPTSPQPFPSAHAAAHQAPPAITPSATPQPSPTPSFTPPPAPSPTPHPAPSPTPHSAPSPTPHSAPSPTPHPAPGASANAPSPSLAPPPSTTPFEAPNPSAAERSSPVGPTELSTHEPSEPSEAKPSKRASKEKMKKRPKKGSSRPRRPMSLMKKIYLVGGGLFMLVLGVLVAPKLIPSSVPDAVQLELISVPPGAQVILNGADTGKRTPTTLPGIKIDQRYQLKLQKKGYQSAEQVISWREGDFGRKVDKKRASFEERVILERSPGQLVIYSDPQGAKVYLNGDYLGLTPLNKKGIKRVDGEHMLLLRHPRYTDPTRTIFKWGEDAQKSFTLKMEGRKRR